MPSRFFPLLVWALMPGAVAAQAPTHRLVVTDHQTIQAGIGYDLRSRDFVVQRWIAYIAEPSPTSAMTRAPGLASATPTAAGSE